MCRAAAPVYLAATNTLALLRLLPMGARDKVG